MSILGVNNILATANQYASKCQKATANSAGFTEKLQTGNEIEGIADKQDTEMFPGNVVVSQPPNYSGITYNKSISNKPKEKMTMDEYKQWFMNEMSQMPVSAWYRSTCVGGSLVITEEAFEKMKSDPKWENTVMNMVRNMYSVNGIMGSKMIGFQVIGASPEECYGEGIPINDNSSSPFTTGNEKSWWDKRSEKMEEAIKGQAIKAQKRLEEKAAEQRRFEQQKWLNEQLASSQSLQDFLMRNAQVGQEMSGTSTASVAGQAVGATTYKGIMDAYSDGITGGGKA